MLTRRDLLASSVLAMPGLARAAGTWPRMVTDMAGRSLRLERPPRRVILGESMVLLNLLFIHPDPVSLLVGMGGDLRRIDPVGFSVLARRFPKLADVPELTQQVGQDLPLEQLIALQPDLLVMAAWQRQRPGAEETLRTVERAGIPVIFVDFFINPLSRALASLRLLGEALDRREAADAFAGLYTEQLERVRQAIAGRPPVRVLMQAFPGQWPCCWVAGEQGGGEFLTALRAENVALAQLPSVSGGNLGVEQVLSTRPEVYVATGMALPDQGVRVGFGVAPDVARDSLAAVLKAPELAALPAVREGRAHAIWNYLGGTVVNVAALQAMAGWLYPDLARTLDARATLAEINGRFAAVPWEGTFWTGL